MKFFVRCLVIIPLFLLLVSCSQKKSKTENDMITMKNIQLAIDQKPVEVTWEKNTTVKELQERLLEGELKLNLTSYGHFEQVGPLGFELVSQDKQQTAKPGDIMLYNGENLVLFHGKNAWAYTKLGQMTVDDAELAELLDKPQVLVSLSIKN